MAYLISDTLNFNFMKKLNTYLLLSSLTIIFFSCTKKDDVEVVVEQMPNYTELGLNTAAFRVNGKLTIAKSIDNFPPVLSEMYPRHNTNYFLVRIDRKTPSSYESIMIKIFGIRDTGIYYARNRCEICDSSYISYYNSRIGNGYMYYATRNHVGVIHITKLDTANRIVAGKFYFTGKLFENGDEKDTIRITEGQFDTKLINFYW